MAESNMDDISKKTLNTKREKYLIKQETKLNIQKCKEFSNINAESSNGPVTTVGPVHPDINCNDFPMLGQQKKQKIKIKEPVDVKNTMRIDKPLLMSKRSKTVPITVNLLDIIPKSELQIVPKEKCTVKLYEGNILDSSMPDRKKGKHREIPKKKGFSKLKKAVLKEHSSDVNITYQGIHSQNFQIYCDNCINDDLNASVELFLNRLVKFQENLYKRDSIKGFAKRRYVIGFKEVKKMLLLKKLNIIIIAPNLNLIKQFGALHNTVDELKSIAKLNNTLYVFALQRRRLGEIMLKFVPVSCVGVIDYSGAEDNFKKIQELLYETRLEYENIQPVQQEPVHDLANELSNNFIEALK